MTFSFFLLNAFSCINTLVSIASINISMKQNNTFLLEMKQIFGSSDFPNTTQRLRTEGLIVPSLRDIFFFFFFLFILGVPYMVAIINKVIKCSAIVTIVLEL